MWVGGAFLQQCEAIKDAGLSYMIPVYVHDQSLQCTESIIKIIRDYYLVH